MCYNLWYLLENSLRATDVLSIKHSFSTDTHTSVFDYATGLTGTHYVRS